MQRCLSALQQVVAMLPGGPSRPRPAAAAQVGKMALGREPAFEEHGPHCLPYTSLYCDGERLRLRGEQAQEQGAAERAKRRGLDGLP
jgi:hypothetical protein